MKNGLRFFLSVGALCVGYSVHVPFALAWDPLTDAGENLVAWYDASDVDTVLTSGTTVTNWLDKSANGYDLDTRDNSVNFDGYDISGLPTIRFSYVGNIKRTGIVGVDLTEVCLITVAEYMSGYGDTSEYGNLKSTDGSDLLQINRPKNVNYLEAKDKIDGTQIVFSTPGDASMANDIPVLAAGYYDGDKGYIRANGGVVSSSNDLPNGATFNLNEIIAGRTSGTANYLYGEMIILNTADIDTIEKVEGYLAHKWGLYASLPTDHPYKYAAPDEPLLFGAISASNITTTSAELYVAAVTNLTSATLVWDTSDKGTTNVSAWASSISVLDATPGTIMGDATGLTEDTEYFFRFYGEGGTTNGWSTLDSFVTPFTALQAPVFTNAALTPTSVQLYWQINSSNQTGFVLQRTTNEINGYTTINSTIGADTTTYTDSGLEPETTYYYQLTATNSVNGSFTTFSLCQTNVTTLRFSTIAFDKQLGTGGDDSVIAALGSPMPSATAPTRAGFGFAGYFTSADGQGTKYYNADMSSARNWDMTSDETLFAYWNETPVVDAGSAQTLYIGSYGNWSPGKLALHAWYDASDTNTIHVTDGGVSQWDDKSTNGNNATQSDLAKMPTTEARQIGGLNAINFDAGENFVVPSFNFIGKECWAVINKDTVEDFFVLGSSANVQVAVLKSGKMRIWPSFNIDTQSSTLIDVGSDYFLGFRALTPKAFSINGTEEVTANIPTGALTITRIMENQYAKLGDGLIGEIVVTAAGLAPADREKIEGYLAWKWSLKANLPAEHPYAGTEQPLFTEVSSVLTGNVADSDSAPTYLWTDTGTGTGRGLYFDDPTVLNPTVSFTEEGTYILQLTADDGISTVSDTVTITVTFPPAGTTIIVR